MELLFTVHGFDPGVTTGYARLEVYKVNGDFYVYLKELREIPGGCSKEALAIIIEVLYPTYTLGLTDSSTTRLAIENFVPGGIQVKFVSLEIIGALKMYCKLLGYDFRIQLPATRKWIDKRWPGRFQKFVSHPGDGLRHALLYVYEVLEIKEFQFVPLDSPLRD